MADLRNIYSAKDAKRAGFEIYAPIGREAHRKLVAVDTAAE